MGCKGSLLEVDEWKYEDGLAEIRMYGIADSSLLKKINKKKIAQTCAFHADMKHKRVFGLKYSFFFGVVRCGTVSKGLNSQCESESESKRSIV